MNTLRLFIVALSIILTSCGTISPIAHRTSNGITTGTTIEEGVASWYGPNFHGNLTANGETYDMFELTAAHRTLPFDTIVKVENLDNGRSVTVRINDRGPYAKNRIIDLSKKAAQKIGMLGPGTARVSLTLLEGTLEGTHTTNLKVPTYTIQLASFKEEERARQHSAKIKGSRVETIVREHDTVYRVYYGTYIDSNKAQKKQKELEKRGHKGYVKQLQN